MDNPVLEIEGHLNPNEADLLEKLASEVTEGCIVEIGSLRGKSTYRLMCGALVSSKEVYAIDPHDPFMDGKTLVGVDDREVFLKNMVASQLAHIVKPVYLKSHHVAQGWSEPIGLLWIDGDHSYEGVKQDILDWTPFVVSGGLIAFHDSYFETVSRAISELLEDEQYKMVTRADATTVIQYTSAQKTSDYMLPDVSVLIPCFQSAKTIEKAVLSALRQEGVSVEVVVCNDASTDNPKIKYIGDDDALRKLYEPVVLVSHEINRGLAAALNTAAMTATGRYFIELDSDDQLAPNCLAEMVKALDDHPEIGFVYGQTQYHGLSDMLFTPQPFQRGIFRFGFASLYAFMYRREAWDNGCRYQSTCVIEGRTITIQDWDFALQLTEHMRWDGLALRDLLVLHYNYQKGSLTDFTNLHNQEVVTAFKERWPILQMERV